MPFRYCVYHVSSGKTEPSVAKFRNREAFLEQLNKWNRRHPGVYQYFE